MKKLKVIASILIVISLMSLNPIGVSAEWRKDYTGWWYTEGNSYATGWRNLNGSWYYFNSDGYMAHDTIIDGYYLNSSGAWFQVSSGNTSDVTTTNSQNGNTQIVTFADKNLEQVVRNVINKPTGTLYKSDVEKITELVIMSKGISNLSGIENIINLKSLILAVNKINDVSPLRGLTNLETLSLDANQISDISSLKGLINLKDVQLGSNQISDISVLKGLINLKDIKLDNNKMAQHQKLCLTKNYH